MQTFLPYPSFVRSARVLDRQRLGKQRVEAMQLLRVLTNPDAKMGWINHPAAKMWRGHELALARYGLTVCKVWRDERGFRDTCYGKTRDLVLGSTMREIRDAEPPPWFGDVAFHKSHRSNLVRKLPDHYRRFFPNVRDDLPYVWPVS